MRPRSRDEVYRWVLHGTEVPYCVLRGSTSTMLDRLVSDYRGLRDWVDT